MPTSSGTDDRQLTIGARAASKLLVQLVRVLLIVLAWNGSAWAQGAEPFAITDNSFLIEEAFNQEAGIFQNIFTVSRSKGGGWETTFTQEWPIGGMKNQFSYVVPFSGSNGHAGIGDLLLSYRFQAMSETDSRPAFAPRISVILPSGDDTQGFGNGVVGWQVNLPFSKQAGNIYAHWNAGITIYKDVSTPGRPGREDTTANLLNWNLGGSAIWQMRPMVNLMLEAVAEFVALPAPFGQTTRARQMTISPGVRGGWNVGDSQVILGIAAPISFARNDQLSALRIEAFKGFDVTPPMLEDDRAILVYFSCELPFKRP